MTQLRIGLIGAGNMGRTHAQQWSGIPGVTIAGVMDLTHNGAPQLASQYNITAYDDFDALVRGAKPDIIDICTPTPTHAEIAVRAAEAGLAFYAEKPLGRTVAECDTVIAAVEKHGVTASVGHVLRFFPEYASAKRLVDSGGVGQVAAVRTARLAGFPGSGRAANWYADPAQSGGVILDLIIHDLDWLRWTFGPVVRVFAKGLTEGPEHAGIRDYTLVTLRFESGAMGHVAGSWAHLGGFRTTFEIAGDKGLIDHDSNRSVPLTIKTRGAGTSAEAGAVAIPESPLIPEDNPYRRELSAFADAVRAGTTPLVTVYDAREAVRIGCAALESIHTGKAVTL